MFYKHHYDVPINNLGPFGSPSYVPTAFSLRDKHILKESNLLAVKLYKLSGFKPFTNITYINASRKEQHFYIKHIQEFGKLIQLEFDFKKISSPGIYLNQEANNTLFTGSLKYKSKNNNYSIKFSNGIFRDFFQENGGVEDTDLYELNVINDSKNLTVNLQNSNSFKKKYNYFIEQRLDLINLGIDSINYKVLYLNYNLFYTTKQRVFFDNDSNSTYYINSYIDPISSVDSVFNNNFSNLFSVGLKGGNYRVEAYTNFDKINYFQSNGIDTSYNNLWVGAIGSYKNKFLQLNFKGQFGVKGYNYKDIDSELNFSYNKKKYILKGGASYYRNEPELKYKNYFSNHFSWNNYSFTKEAIIGGYFDFQLKKAKIDFKGETKLINNSLFYDSLSIARQENNQVMITSLLLAKDYRLLNFHFRTAFIYQLTSDELLFPLPEVEGRQVLYYQRKIFKGAMKFQIGAGFSYSTNYFGYAYMPAIGEYTKQGGSTEMGFYPRLDLFINTRLKRAQIFLKYEHFNAGRSLQKSYITQGYPPMGKSLKFGVSWNMFD